MLPESREVEDMKRPKTPGDPMMESEMYDEGIVVSRGKSIDLGLDEDDSLFNEQDIDIAYPKWVPSKKKGQQRPKTQ